MIAIRPLGDKNNAIACELQGLAGEWWKRIPESCAAAPDLTRCVTGRLAHPKRPWPRTNRNEWELVLLTFSADERNLFPVRRPSGEQVAF